MAERFEYLVLLVSGNQLWTSDGQHTSHGADLPLVLNEYGAAGWEVVAGAGFGAESKDYREYVLKRRV